MRTEVQRLAALGRLPSESAPPEAIAGREVLVRAIAGPLDLNEAKALAQILGDDNCFGLAWSVLHLIETAPGWDLKHIPSGSSPWLATMRARIFNARGASNGA